ncbi:MAG: hypothetical protein K5681_08815 [Treponema sp.]|nr:hypothetical protein [Treponema sp.]
MILAIILLILIVLILAIIILFSFYIFLPSLNADNLENDPIISDIEKDFSVKEETERELTNKKAIVLCSCGKTFTHDKSIYNEAYTCFMVKNMSGSGTDCKYACIGLGDCVKACSQNAIIIKNDTAVITNNCCGCGKCAEVCPQKLIKLVAKDTKTYVLCKNTDINSFTTCSNKQKEEKVEWIEKKDFKIWSYCYKIFNTVNKLFK